MVFVKVDSVVVHATSVTATSRVLTVLAYNRNQKKFNINKKYTDFSLTANDMHIPFLTARSGYSGTHLKLKSIFPEIQNSNISRFFVSAKTFKKISRPKTQPLKKLNSLVSNKLPRTHRYGHDRG